MSDNVMASSSEPPKLPAGAVLRTVPDAVVAKRHDDGTPVTISDLVAAYNRGRGDLWTPGQN